MSQQIESLKGSCAFPNANFSDSVITACLHISKNALKANASMISPDRYTDSLHLNIHSILSEEVFWVDKNGFIFQTIAHI